MSAERKRVVLVGNSLVLAAVQASLQVYPDLEVIALEDPLAEAMQEVRALRPSSIIFDLTSVQPGLPFSLLPDQPDLLIGLDPASDRAVLWSGQEARALSMRDLAQIIQTHNGKSQEEQRRNR